MNEISVWAFTLTDFQNQGNKIAIVCGGASGIGRATVERFINDGAHVAIFDLNPNYEPFQAKYEKKITFYKTDCSKKSECEANANCVAEIHGKINHLGK